MSATDKPLAVQLYIGKHKPGGARMKPIENGPLAVKPKGGLWTSTWEHGSCGWIEWCRSNEPGWIEDKDYWLLTPNPETRVLHVDSMKDLQALHKAYPHDQHGFLGYDFVTMARDYDAMHLTDRGQWRTRLTYPLSLYGWDCESTLWFHWRFTKVERIEPPTREDASA